jgi:uncharacterized protein (DUF1684 family)
MDRLKPWIKSGIIILTFSFYNTFGQNADAIKDIQAHRKKQKKEFLKGEKSPLGPEEKRKFKGFNFYPIDLKYRVEAAFIRTEGLPLFKMQTTGDRLPQYVKYGEVHFKIDDHDFALEVYQSPDIMKMPGYEDYLFIPFTDTTNGHETYDVGRYLEFRIPESETVIVDFNKCYNPYCAYSPSYACPIPPVANQLPIAIPVGEKKFH